MTRLLTLSISFLDDRYHGLRSAEGPPEWPPSPFRLFQALVAGNAKGTQLPEPLRKALRWLEALEPPVIIAPPAREGLPILTYVPNNNSDTEPRSRAPKLLRPTLLNGDRLVQYIWKYDDDAGGATENAQTIAGATRHIRCLGWGIDLAVGCGAIAETVPAPVAQRLQYRPTRADSPGGVDLRVPTTGSLESLERTYEAFLNRYKTPGITSIESAAATCATKAYVTDSARPHVAFRLVTPNGDTVSLRHQLIAPLVGMVRQLANRPHVVESLGKKVVDREIMGHPREGAQKRVSILPLPTIREGPTDGRIRRLMLAQPFGSDGDICRLLARLFDGQQLKPLSDEERIPPICLERIERNDAVLPRYTGISQTWASATPVLLPGFDDRRQHRGDHLKRLSRAEQLACKALAQAGIETPGSLELSRVPFWPGSLHVREYCPREKLRHYPRYHVRISFDQPRTGPLAIGAGRHAGFGVFAACPQ